MMSTVADMMDHAARQCSINKILSMVTATTETAMQLKDFLNETAEELLDRIDLPSPITQDVDIIGTGVESYALPADFLRLARDDLAVYEKSSNRRACTPISSNGAWTHLKQFGASGSGRFYRITGDTEGGFFISFFQKLKAGETITVSYVSAKWICGSDGAAKNMWTLPDDKLLLPVAVVRLGVIWRFRQKKGMPFADVQAEYEIRLSRAINDGRGIRTVNMGEAPTRDGPTRLGIPDVIVFS